ncbi:MAG: DUF3644 domain-containing protein [bacterium]|nr:DUF3644 domain-containing protein [bacterium]
MSRPSRSTSLARCAESALVAAVEIYNKPTVEYREQTFALLVVNAWEVMLKARIVQQNGNKLASIYRRDSGGRNYRRNSSGDILTIDISKALGKTFLPTDVRGNIEGLVDIRNRAAHMGILHPDLQHRVLQYGTASVQNFIKLSERWFGIQIRLPYLLPLGLLGSVDSTSKSPNQQQRELLDRLDKLSRSHSVRNSEYAVVMTVEVNLNRRLTGGANVGITRDPDAPVVHVTDDEVVELFSETYFGIAETCRDRYPDFKQNTRFNRAMKEIKENPNCAFFRRTNPHSRQSSGMWLYNLEEALEVLDEEYRSTNES